MRETHRIAMENLKGTLLRRKRDYDVKLKQESYEVGDCVYKLNNAAKKGVSKKLPLYDGPFIVTWVLSPILIEIESRKRKKVVHHNKLKPCNDRFFRCGFDVVGKSFYLWMILSPTMPMNTLFLIFLIYLHKIIPMTMI